MSMPEETQPLFDKSRIRKDFDRAAPGYDVRAGLQRRVAEKLFAYAKELIPADANVLDVGAGTGFIADMSMEAGQGGQGLWHITQMDLSHEMCRIAAHKPSAKSPYSTGVVNGDIDALPFPAACFDAAVSSLTFQWLDQVEHSLRELYRSLKPGGIVLISSFGPQTLQELRESFNAADRAMAREGQERVNRFLTLERIRHAAHKAGFEEFFSTTQMLVEHYPDVWEVMQQNRAIGGGNKLSNRSRALTGKGRFLAMTKHYTESYGTEQGLPATWEIYFFSARKA